MKTKRGFTLLEIVIVITVLGILTVVMIPIISNAIKNARIENDKVLVDNINAILKADEPYNGRPSTGDEVLWLLSGNGLDIDNTNYENHAFYWSIDDNKVLIYNSEEECVLYPEELKQVNVTENDISEKVSSNEWFLIAGDYTYNELAYKITYYVNGKKIKFYGKTSYDGTIDKLELPIPNVYGAYSEGYEFDGWYTNIDLTGNKISKIIINNSIESQNSNELTLEKLEDLVFYSSFKKIELDDFCANNPDADECKDHVTDKVKYSIIYHTNGGTLNNPQTSYLGPLEEAIVLSIPTRDGYEFNGWYTTYNFVTGTKEESIEIGSIGNKVFYASWKKLPDEEVEEKKLYIITYRLDGGTISESAPKSYYGPLEETINLVTPIKEKCNFLGWYENPEFSGEVVTSISVGSSGDKVFYAKWEPNMAERPANTYYITYELNGGTLYNPPREINGVKDFYLFTPLKRGYNFGGWYLNEDLEGEPIEVILKDDQTKDYTVYAKWIVVEYNINYNLNGGTWENQHTVNYVYTIDKVVKYTQEVIYEGHAFIGWFDNPELEGEPVVETLIGDTGDKTLYAGWDANKANIYYRNLDKVIDEIDIDSWPKTFSFDEEVILPVPEVAGYNFLGWYEKEDLTGDPITKIEKGTINSKFLYAKWETIKYNITYVYQHNAETIIFDNKITSYTIEDTIDFGDIQPSTTYYTFNGWYEDSNFNGEEFTTIKKGTTGNITLYAKWEGIPLVISAEFNGGTLQNRTITQFAEELVNDFNAYSYELGKTTQVTELVLFKKTTDKNINYLWGNNNIEMIEKYQWFFEFAKEEIMAAAETSGYNTGAYKYIYDSVIKMFNVLLSEPGDPLYYYKPNALNVAQYKPESDGVYTINGCNDTEGNNKTLFRSWLDGLLNSSYYYAADIYRACMVDYSNSTNMQRFNKAYTGNELYVVTKDILPSPVQVGHTFLGWYDNPEYTGNEYENTVQIYDLFSSWEASGEGYKKDNFTLYAKWEEIPSYTITFELNRGHWEDKTFDSFVEELIHYFRIPYDSNKNDRYYKETTKEQFFITSRPNIDLVWYDAANLYKYQWFLKFIKNEINTYAPNSYTETRKFMENITAENNGIMKDANINYFNPEDAKYNSTAIEILCEMIHAIINQCGATSGNNRTWIPDYSKAENMARFYNAYYSTDLKGVYNEGESLPTPIRDGYTFLGWYNNAGYKVDKATKDEKLSALWQKNVSNNAELASAIEEANVGTVSSIYLEPGEYSGNYTITKNWISIYGPNYNVNPNTGTRNPAATFIGTITLKDGLDGFLLAGIDFKEAAKINANRISNFTFRNNYVYNTDAGKTWVETEKYNSGFLTILLPAGDATDNTLKTKLSTGIDIRDNRFENVKDVNVYIANSKNVNISGNVFKNFESDAVRFGDAFTDGVINIEDNKFIQDSTTNTSTNGIYFCMYGKVKESTDCSIYIRYNEFVNIGYNSTAQSVYKGAISARNYKEFGATFIITNNYFKDCYNYIRLRNNADAANHSSYKWSATIENNQFIGLPTAYYYVSKELSTDDEDNSPSLSHIDRNYYEVIVDGATVVFNSELIGSTTYRPKFTDVLMIEIPLDSNNKPSVTKPIS